MKEFNVVESPKGTYQSELDITVEEWKTILLDKSITTINYKKALVDLYNFPDHTASCKQLSLKYAGTEKEMGKYNAWITGFGKVVAKHLNRFKIVDTDGKQRFWHVPICKGKYLDNRYFAWTLRPELIEAIEQLGWSNNYTWVPFYMEMADKVLAYKDKMKDLIDICMGLDNQYIKYIKDFNNGAPVSYIDPFSVFSIFNRGNNEKSRNEITTYFKKELGIEASVPSDYNGIPVVNAMYSYFMNKENGTNCAELWDLFEKILKKSDDIGTAFDSVKNLEGIKWNITMFMFWIRPYEYIGLDRRNRAYLPSKGVDIFKENELNWENYNIVLNKVIEKMNDGSIEEKSFPEISYKSWLNTESNIWLVGYTYGDSGSQFDRFIKDELWEGRFDTNKSNDKNQLKLSERIKEDDVLVLKSSSTKGSDHSSPFLRIKAIGIVKEIIEPDIDSNSITTVGFKVEYISLEQKDFDGKVYGSYRKTIHLADNKIIELIDYVNNIANPEEIMATSKYQKYIDLLKSNSNLVLTGAPGTGKTYMAQAIADAMGAETEFVQFHPSYDYTDFVEGLRPVDNADGSMGFERKDGIFKGFCKQAIRNLRDAEKSIESLSQELTWKDKFDQFVSDSIENETEFHLSNGNTFRITDIKDTTIVVTNELNEKTRNVSVNGEEIMTLLSYNVPLNIVRDIKNYFGRKFGTQADSYAYVITNEIRKNKKMIVVNASKIDRKDYVIIIDEINRGEASKIFGELFYSIDPGYRGKKDITVKTQYQNIIPETDEFAKGFYVPENVYILATMNDIDRSVESMDFAMRRRFTWQEVTPEDTKDMLDTLGEPLATEAKERMKRLNDVIAETDGLGPAFMIGPSYYLKLAKNGGNFSKLWDLNIEPLLKEYLRGFRKAKENLEAFKNAYITISSEEPFEEIINNED